MERREGRGRVRQELAGLSADPLRIAIYLERRDLSPGARHAAAQFVAQCMTGVSGTHQHFQARFSARGWDMRDVQWDQFGQFNASAALLDDGSYLIRLAIEAPPALLSLAHELSGTAAWPPSRRPWWQAAWSRLAASCGLGRPASALTVWLIGVDELATIPSYVQACAGDTVLLLYYHEVSHVMAGHLGVATTPEETRALEFDADFNAGGLFVGGIANSGEHRWDEAFLRLVRAALLLATPFKAFAVRSADYHFPTVRAIAFITGGMSALVQKVPLSQRKATEARWTLVAHEERYAFEARLRSSSLAYVAGETQALAADVDALEQVTTPTRARLKDGVLKGRAVYP